MQPQYLRIVLHKEGSIYAKDLPDYWRKFYPDDKDANFEKSVTSMRNLIKNFHGVCLAMVTTAQEWIVEAAPARFSVIADVLSPAFKDTLRRVASQSNGTKVSKLADFFERIT